MSLAPGRRLGPYEIVAPLGTGGMGQVYRAVDRRLGREVAVKVLPPDASARPEAAARFAQEARAVASLDHPNIVVLYDLGQEGDLLWVVTELLRGQTLAERLARSPMPWREAIEVGAAVADGLAAAHGKGIVHRDLKPANLFLTEDRRVKILDFGVARVAGPDLPEGGRTTPGSVVGSLGYMAPEQAAGEDAGPTADVFSLGCVVYEMLSGERAFPGHNPVRVLGAILHEEPAPLAGAVPDLPPEVRAVVRRCLAKHPADRYHSAADLALALRATVTSAGTAAVAPPPPTALANLGRRLFGWLRRRPSSLAVLPLAHAGGDPTGVYLSDGIAESVVRLLSPLDGLEVLSWSTSSRYRAYDPRAAGTSLGVSYALTGRLAERGDQVSVAIELVEVATGTCVWAESYQRPATRVFEMQERVAREIARHLAVRLGFEDSRRLARRPTEVDAAYRLYLQGRFHWNKRSPDGLARALDAFEQALAADPRYAQAWAGLADAWSVQPFWGLAPPRRAFPEAQRAARRALDLDGELPEAHVSHGYTSFYFDWDATAAQASFDRALELDPSHAVAHHWLGVALALRGDGDGAVRHLDRALALDPLSLIVHADRALACYLGGDPAEAERRTAAALELDPGFAPAQLYRGLALEAMGDFAAASEALAAAVSAAGGGTAARAARVHTLARAGNGELARRELDALLGEDGERYVSPYLLAVAHLGLGERQAALAVLERAREERCEMLVWLPRDPRLAPLTGEPVYERLRGLLGGTAAPLDLPETTA